jgi:hypothetical protein
MYVENKGCDLLQQNACGCENLTNTTQFQKYICNSCFMKMGFNVI